MSILTSIKNKLLRRREEGADFDYQDMRSNILNEPPRPEGREPASDLPPPESEFPKPVQQESPFSKPPPQDFDDKYRTPSQKRYEELSMDTPTANVPQQSYEVMDKLNLIETQLAAIRSQTETINERLKNLEMRLPRRY